MPGTFDHAVIERVQQANDIVDVVSEHVQLKKKGRELVGLCPFHQDHKPSLYVNPSKQIFKCFACGAGGDVLKFMQMREGLTFPQAVERLAEKAGIQLERSRGLRSQRNNRDQGVDPNLLARLNEWAAKFFQRALADPEQGKVAREYLAQRRISQESIAKWRIGVGPNAADAMARAAAGQKIPSGLLLQGGLTTGGGQDKFAGRLMFTITDVTGRVIGFGGRTLSGVGAKYMNSPATVLFDKSNTLYGLEQARHEIVKTGTVVVVEGYTDVIMAHQFACKNVVATLGTSFTAGHGRILRRYAKRVVLLFDSDTAGRSAASRALEVCLSQRLDIKLGFVEEGKDPCEFLLTAGKDGFDRVVAEATDVLQFKWDQLHDAFERDDSMAARRTVLDEFLQAVATGLAANNLPLIESGLIVNRLSKIMGLPAREINAELGRRMGRISNSAASVQERQPGSQTVDWGRGLYAVAQREILEALVNEPELFAKWEGELSESLFDVPVLQEISRLLLDVLRSTEDFSINALLARIESVPLAECLVELQTVGEEKGNHRSRLADSIEVLRRQRTDSKASGGQMNKEERGRLQDVDNRPLGRNPYSIGMS